MPCKDTCMRASQSDLFLFPVQDTEMTKMWDASVSLKGSSDSGDLPCSI